MNPTSIPGTRRQRITTRSGDVLHRQYIFMTETAWDSLQRLSVTSHRSGSQIIEELVKIAARGNPVKETKHERTTPEQASK